MKHLELKGKSICFDESGSNVEFTRAEKKGNKITCYNESGDVVLQLTGANPKIKVMENSKESGFEVVK